MSYFTVGTGNGARETSVRIRLLAAAGVAAVAVSAAACSSSPSSTSAGSGTPSSAALKTATIGGVTVVTNGRGFTLYSFGPDSAGRSVCNGACAQYWPPVTGPATAGPGVTGKLGTITRSDGSKQATYNGHPLYTYIADTAPGQAKGNNLNLYGGLWREVTVPG